MSAATTMDAKATRKLSELPGPKQTLFFGNALQLDVRHIHLQLERWAAEYGPMYQLRVLKRQVIVIEDPALNEIVFRARPDSYRRPTHVAKVLTEMGFPGVFGAEGAEWRSQRRLAMEALATRHLRGFFPKLAMIMERFTKRWEKAADDNRVLDVATELKLLTVDVTTLLVFGHDLDTLGKADDDEELIQKHLEVFFPAFDRRMNAIVPYWRLVRLPKDRHLDRACAGIGEWIGKRIDIARARLAEDPTHADKPENFIESMLVARDTEGKPFTDAVIKGNALTMLLAGEDTTAHSIAWAIHHLCDEPVVLEKLHEELARVLGEATVPATLEQANNLPYAAGIGNESLRLRAVAPVQFNEALEDVILGGIEIPKGASIIALNRLAAMDETRFADAKSFKPERWIAEKRTGAHETAAFVPFGSGPRICPGRALALLEMKLAFAAIYQRLEIERVGDATEVQEIVAFTMMCEGLRVRVKRRTPTA